MSVFPSWFWAEESNKYNDKGELWFNPSAATSVREIAKSLKNARQLMIPEDGLAKLLIQEIKYQTKQKACHIDDDITIDSRSHLTGRDKVNVGILQSEGGIGNQNAYALYFDVGTILHSQLTRNVVKSLEMSAEEWMNAVRDGGIFDFKRFIPPFNNTRGK